MKIHNALSKAGWTIGNVATISTTKNAIRIRMRVRLLGVLLAECKIMVVNAKGGLVLTVQTIRGKVELKRRDSRNRVVSSDSCWCGSIDPSLADNDNSGNSRAEQKNQLHPTPGGSGKSTPRIVTRRDKQASEPIHWRST